MWRCCVVGSPGKEATEAFEDVGHSPDAREIQLKYLIGELSELSSGKVKVCLRMCVAARRTALTPLYLSLAEEHQSQRSGGKVRHINLC